MNDPLLVILVLATFAVSGLNFYLLWREDHR